MWNGFFIPGIVANAGAVNPNKFWVAKQTGFWSDPANWSAISGGVGGATVPTSTDVPSFDANGPGNILLDSNITLKQLKILDTTTRVLDFQGYNLTVDGDITFLDNTIMLGLDGTIIQSLTGNILIDWRPSSYRNLRIPNPWFLTGTGTIKIKYAEVQNLVATPGVDLINCLDRGSNTGQRLKMQLPTAIALSMSVSDP